MNSSSRYRVVWVTAPDLKTARRIAQAVLGARLVACANLIPKLESYYWWKGRVESASEVLLIMKTKASLLAELERMVLALHPYETPEFVVMSLKGGNSHYLKWISDSTQSRSFSRATAKRPKAED